MQSNLNFYLRLRGVCECVFVCALFKKSLFHQIMKVFFIFF